MGKNKKIVYRCGWCGNFTSDTGFFLEPSDWLAAKQNLEEKDCETVKVNGIYCRHEANY